MATSIDFEIKVHIPVTVHCDFWIEEAIESIANETMWKYRKGTWSESFVNEEERKAKLLRDELLKQALKDNNLLSFGSLTVQLLKVLQNGLGRDSFIDATTKRMKAKRFSDNVFNQALRLILRSVLISYE